MTTSPKSPPPRGRVRLGASLLLLSILAAAAPATRAGSPLDRLPADRAGEVVRRAIDWAGGWEAWAAKETADYTKTQRRFDDEGPAALERERHRYRLRPGLQMRIDGLGEEAGTVIVNDGERAVMTEDGEPDTSPAGRDRAWNATFGSHYMFAIPFKLTDEGAHLEHAGQQELADGTVTDKIRVTYDPGAGSSGGLHTWTYHFAPDGRLAAYHLRFGEGPEDYRFTEYYDVEEEGGIRLPACRRVYRSNAAAEKLGVVSEICHRDIRWNVAFPEGLFEAAAE